MEFQIGYSRSPAASRAFRLSVSSYRTIFLFLSVKTAPTSHRYPRRRLSPGLESYAGGGPGLGGAPGIVLRGTRSKFTRFSSSPSMLAWKE
jgi:hypothetical protein